MEVVHLLEHTLGYLKVLFLSDSFYFICQMLHCCLTHKEVLHAGGLDAVKLTKKQLLCCLRHFGQHLLTNSLLGHNAELFIGLLTFVAKVLLRFYHTEAAHLREYSAHAA
jgi:hypothetical protein